jgi:hypothetical protein
VISWINVRGKIQHLKPLTKGDFAVVNISNCIQDLSECLYLYNGYQTIPKEEVVRRYIPISHHPRSGSDPYVQSRFRLTTSSSDDSPSPSSSHMLNGVQFYSPASNGSASERSIDPLDDIIKGDDFEQFLQNCDS